MKSMTGYGASEYQNDMYRLAIEIKSYNNRYLDILFNAPPYLSCYETKMKEMIKQVVKRGHVDVNIKLKQFESQVDVMVDTGVVKQYTEAFKKIITLAGTNDTPHLTHYLHTDDVLKMIRNQDVAKYEQPLMTQLAGALKEYAVTKDREGEATLHDINMQLASFEEGLSVVKEFAEILEIRIKDSLTKRFKQLLEDEYDETRVLQEVAVMLMKYTINEEIQRIESHLIYFKDEIKQERPVGKRLDFICQEFNREINTIASKSIIVEVNQAVVGMKDSLENIREQLRNIE